MVQEVESKLQAELEAGLEKCVSETNSFMKPVEEATAAVVEKLKDAERRRAELAEELEGLKQRAASIGEKPQLGACSLASAGKDVGT